MSKLPSLPMKNCGICGERSCKDFLNSVENNKKRIEDCPFYNNETDSVEYIHETRSANLDIHGNEYDFLLMPVPNEKSARKIIQPFRPDLVEKYSISKGDFIMGRPMSAGCPVTHILEIYDADPITGILCGWPVGPKMAREGHVIDIKAYTMAGFEGMATSIAKEPVVGKTAAFMPNFCMLQLTHYGLINTVFFTNDGVFVRIEDIHVAK